MNLPSRFRIRNVRFYYSGTWQLGFVEIEQGRITQIQAGGPADNISGPATGVGTSANKDQDTDGADRLLELDGHGHHLFPGFTDVHVHFRSPGLEQKETIATGSAAAAHGGFTCVCTMPNLDPVPDNLEALQLQRDLIKEQATVHVLPYGSITINEKGNHLSEMAAMAPYVCGFSDDGFGVQSETRMKEALELAKSLGKPIVAHAEDASKVNGGVIHDGEYARAHNHRGNPSESEWSQVKRDIELVRETGAAYHVCHVSTKESVALIRQAQDEGLDITCETAPHYLVLHDLLLQEDGRFRMNPPIRSLADQKALREALAQGVITCIATDHAPHTAQEKAGGLDHSINGVVGLETSFPVLYTHLVKPGLISLEKLVELMSFKAVARFGLDQVQSARAELPVATAFEIGQPADLTLFDLDKEYTVNPEDFLTKGKASPFTGDKVFGACQLTLVGGEIAWATPELTAVLPKKSGQAEQLSKE